MAVLSWLIMYATMLIIAFSELAAVFQRPKGLFITLVVNG